jgi:hypothetical protein
MKKFSIPGFAAGMLSIVFTVPSHAANLTNGIALNGIALNGLTVNGTNLNGLTQSGTGSSDKNLNIRQTRQAMQGITLNQVKISMPR